MTKFLTQVFSGAASLPSGNPAAATLLYVDTTPGTPLEVATPSGMGKRNLSR